MKKIGIIIAFFALALVLNAQDRAKVLDRNQYFYEFNLGAADTVTSNDSLYNIQLLANKPEPVKYDIQTTVDSVSGTTGATIILQGKVFESDTYTNIDTVTWGQTTSDTTFNFTNTSSVSYYRYLNMYYRTTTGAIKVSGLDFKLWDK